MERVIWRQVCLFLVLLGLTVLRLLLGQAKMDINLIWWWLGAVIGFLFVFADQFVYTIVNGMGEARRWGQGLMRSALFVVVWVVLAVFAATSTGSVFPRGFVLGLGTHLIFDLSWDYFLGGRDVSFWFRQIKNISRDEVVWFVRGSIVFYLLIMWFL